MARFPRNPTTSELVLALGPPNEYRVEEAVGGGWITLCRGFQIGGVIDASGAGNAVWRDREAAIIAAWAHVSGDPLPVDLQEHL